MLQNQIIIMVQIEFWYVCVFAQEKKIFTTVKQLITEDLNQNINRSPLKFGELRLFPEEKKRDFKNMINNDLT